MGHYCDIYSSIPVLKDLRKGFLVLDTRFSFNSKPFASELLNNYLKNCFFYTNIYTSTTILLMLSANSITLYCVARIKWVKIFL